VIAAICVYLLAGMLFTFLYSVVAVLGSGPLFAEGTDGTTAIRLTVVALLVSHIPARRAER
jgi:hypothetical protein